MAENLTFNQALNLYKIRYRVMYHNYLESLADPRAFISLENMYGRLMEMRYVLMEMFDVTENELEGLADDAKNDRPVIITRGDHIRTMTDEELEERLQGYADQYGIDVEELVEGQDMGYIRKNELDQRVLTWLRENVVVEEIAETEAMTAEQTEAETDAAQTEAQIAETETEA